MASARKHKLGPQQGSRRERRLQYQRLGQRCFRIPQDDAYGQNR